MFQPFDPAVATNGLGRLRIQPKGMCAQPHPTTVFQLQTMAARGTNATPSGLLLRPTSRHKNRFDFMLCEIMFKRIGISKLKGALCNITSKFREMQLVQCS
jgi:hypothetical protein